MKEEPITRESKGRRFVGGCLWTVIGGVLFFLLAGFSPRAFVVPEIAMHFVLGWAFHAWKALPSWLVHWQSVVVPAGCLLLAVWLLHRFVIWWQAQKNELQGWRFRHTMFVLTLLLLGSAAAIAMSGILHQSVWLMGTPWIESNQRVRQTMAVNNARQLMLALFEFHDTKKRFPDSLQELEDTMDLPPQMSWIQTRSGSAPEPFVLLRPGQMAWPDENTPILISPIFAAEHRVIVGFGDLSARSVVAKDLKNILAEAGSAEPNPPGK